MAKLRKNALQDLCARLGLSFKNPALLTLAVTHASARLGSAANEDNERLEFLGDRVLGLAVAELLAESFPHAREGELARWFNNLVRAETCAEIAQEWGLGDCIVMSGKKGIAEGRILGDACEAVLGAIFVDSLAMWCKNSGGRI